MSLHRRAAGMLAAHASHPWQSSLFCILRSAEAMSCCRCARSKEVACHVLRARRSPCCISARASPSSRARAARHARQVFQARVAAACRNLAPARLAASSRPWSTLEVDHRSSVAISGHQGSSAVISGHHSPWSTLEVDQWTKVVLSARSRHRCTIVRRKRHCAVSAHHARSARARA